MQNEIKLFNNKKGFEGSNTVMIILFIFVGVGIIIPFVNDEFGTSSPDFNVDNPANQLIEEDFSDISGVGAGDILKSVGKMFFWTFGDLPFWLDAIFIILRIMLLSILIKAFTPFL